MSAASIVSINKNKLPSYCTKFISIVNSNVDLSIPKDVLLIIAKYARPWYGNTAFRFGGAVPGIDGAVLDTKEVNILSSFQFNAKENKWITLSEMPFPKAYAAAVLHCDSSTIFVSGGSDKYGVPSSSMLRYSLTDNKWYHGENGSGMRAHRAHHTAVEYNDLIFVIGGYMSGLHLSSCEVFDITKNTWSDLTHMKEGRCLHSSVVVNAIDNTTYIYAIGGVDNKRAERYDISSNQWSRIADMFVQRFYHKSIALSDSDNNKIILNLGGYVGLAIANCTSIVEQYNVNENNWFIAKWELPTPRANFSMHILNDNDDDDHNHDQISVLICGGEGERVKEEMLSSCLRIWLTASGECVKCIEMVNVNIPLFIGAA